MMTMLIKPISNDILNFTLQIALSTLLKIITNNILGRM